MQAVLVRVFCDEHDRHGSHPLARAVVRFLWDSGASGVTVLRGLEGFGGRRHLHDARNEALRANLPVVVEWVETPERFAEIWPQLEPMVAHVLVTRENVELLAMPPQR